MTRSLTLLGAFAAAAMAADSTTISMIIPGDPAPYVGSVVAADKSATTVVVKCKDGTPSEDCGAPENGFTIAQGPSTWHLTQSFSGDDAGLYDMVATCKLEASKDAASCHVAVTQDIDGQRTTQTTDTVENYKTMMMPVVITAGADQIGAAPGATATGGDSSQTATTAAASGSQATNTATKTDATESGASKTAASASTSKGTNAAGPMVTQNAILAGVAAVIGGAIAL